jgi:ppGpp synthetase/RelA/SpoT-type nucleotidyltranferase
MIVPLKVQQLFDDASPYVTELSKRVTETLFSYCGRKGYAFSFRPKTIESLAEKIETGRFKRWTDIDDLFACTIVIPTLREESEAIEFLRSAFYEERFRARNSTHKSPDVFRFEASRFIAKLHRPANLDPAEPLFNLTFEVQVRTAFEHAWSVTTHELVYKSPCVDWKRMRLAAQLKAAVEQLDSLILAFDQSAGYITAHHWPEIAARATIADFYSKQVEIGKIPPELAPKDWSRFAENVYSLLKSAQQSRQVDMQTVVTSALSIIQKEVDNLSSSQIPRSISIFQFTLGVLRKEKVINNKLHNFYPMITSELGELYPDVKSIQPRFEV